MGLGLKIVSFLLLALDFILRPLNWWIERTPPRRIPPNSNPLLQISAVKLAKKIREQQITSTEVVLAYIKRIREVNPVLNAVVEDRYEAAIKEAKLADLTIASGSHTAEELEKNLPLLGVPVTIKESCGVEGMSQSGGTLARSGVKASGDGRAVAKLRAAGAIFIAVTNTPELCLSWDSVNLITGRTVNPYNTHRTSGGSSGGEGALVGAGASVVGIGSDIAGSIRVPAMFNGIFGHKPTGGIVSINGHYPYTADEKFAEYLVIGPIARYAEDLSLFLTILAGDNASKLNLDSKVNLSALTIHYMEDAGPSKALIPVEEDIKRVIRKSVLHLKHICSAHISDIKFPELINSVELSIPVFFSELTDIPNLLQNPNNPKESHNLILEFIKSLFGLSRFSLNALFFYILMETNGFIPRSQTPYHKQKFNSLHEKFEETLGKDGVFLYPTFPTAAFGHHGILTKIIGVMYAMIFNIMGFPSTHVPLGFNKDGLPIGLQVVAGRNQDRLCLAVAKELEDAFGGWVPPPTL